MAISQPIVIDGTTYPHIHFLSIKRSFSVLDGENAGRVMTGAMERDVIGTFYNYAVEIDADDATPAEYDNFYEVISSPQDSHTIVVPYAQTTLTFDAYVTNGTDDLEYMMPIQNRWGNLSFNFIAMSPQRTPT
jgi:hypothetical protein